MTLVIAHRGASAQAPENTIAAFERARALGADWVELDVRVTADGALAVVHDAHLPDGRAVHKVVAADLPPTVPLLAGALAAGQGMEVNVEIKNAPREPAFDPTCRSSDLVVDEVRRAGRTASVLVSSFHLGSIDRVRELEPALATAWLVARFDADTLAILIGHGHRVLHPWDAIVTADLVGACRAAGVDVNVWTVDDPARMVELAGWGVHGICTNVPDVAVAALGG